MSRHVFKYLKNGNNEIDMNQDGTHGPMYGSFRLTVPCNKEYWVWRVNLVIRDHRAITLNGFGGQPDPLDLGLLISYKDSDDQLLTDYTGGVPIRTNGDFVFLAGVDAQTFSPPGSMDLLPIRWTIARAGTPLHMTCGQYLEFLVQDNLTGLRFFRTMVQGFSYRITEAPPTPLILDP